MAKDRPNDDVMMGYILGELSDDEQVRLEELYFVDDRTFEQLAALEDELIDAYVRGELSAQQRKLFELHFLNSRERRRKLAFAESFIQYLSELPGTTSAAERKTWGNRVAGWLGVQRSTVRWAFAAAGAVVLLIGAGLVRENWRLRTQLRQMQAEQTQLRQREEQLSRQLAQRELPPTGSAPEKAPEEAAWPEPHSLPVVAFTLTPGLVRGSAEQKTVIIPHGPHLVRLRIDVESNQAYESYRATLETVDGTKVWSKEELKATEGGRALVVDLPSSLLRNEDYILKLRGQQNRTVFADLGGYSFRVVKR